MVILCAIFFINVALNSILFSCSGNNNVSPGTGVFLLLGDNGSLLSPCLDLGVHVESQNSTSEERHLYKCSSFVFDNFHLCVQKVFAKFS